MRRGWESWNWWKSEENRARLFSVAPSDRTTQTEIHEAPSEHKKKTHFFCEGGTGCPERLWSLHPWRQSKCSWALSLATCSHRPCLSRRIEVASLQRCFLVSVILRFHDFMKKVKYIRGYFHCTSLHMPSGLLITQESLPTFMIKLRKNCLWTFS